MQPLGLAADPEAGFVHVLDRGAGHQVAHRGDETLQARGTIAAHPGDGGGDQFDTEQIGHQFGQAILGQQLVVQQIDHEGRDPGAILHRRVDPVGKRGARVRPAAGAYAVVGAMLGDDEWARFGQIEHLPGAVARTHGGRHRRTAGRAGGWKVTDDAVGFGNLPQGLAFMAFLAARLLARRFARAAHPGRRLLQSITGGWLAAVAAVQAQLALKFRDTGLQSLNLGRLRLYQRNQLFPRRLRLRIAIHESLNPNAIPLSRKIYWRDSERAATPPGQLHLYYLNDDDLFTI